MATESKTPAQAQPKETLSVYSAEELAANARIFGASREIVAVALQLAGKASATVPEAKAIIEKFRAKEVK